MVVFIWWWILNDMKEVKISLHNKCHIFVEMLCMFVFRWSAACVCEWQRFMCYHRLGSDQASVPGVVYKAVSPCKKKQKRNHRSGNMHNKSIQPNQHILPRIAVILGLSLGKDAPLSFSPVLHLFYCLFFFLVLCCNLSTSDWEALHTLAWLWICSIHQPRRMKRNIWKGREGILHTRRENDGVRSE